MKAVMYGAGSIGRGYIGEIFYDSGFETVFVDIDESLMAEVDAAGRYPIRFVTNDSWHEKIIENVSGICTDDEQAVFDAICGCGIMATSVGTTVLPKIAPYLARALRYRWEQGNEEPLNILVCENMVKANRYLESLVRDCMESREDKENLEKLTGFVETTIGRNIPVMDKSLYGDNPLRVIAEEYYPIPIDITCVKGELPKIAHAVPLQNFDFAIRQKLMMYNMTHAVAGYLGSILKIEFLYQTMEVPEIRYIVQKAFGEISLGMSREYDVPLKELEDFCRDLLYRYHNKNLKIAVPRLSTEPQRKLSKEDRLVGAADICVSNGVYPAFICIGIAAGYVFDNGADAKEIQKCISEKGIAAALEKYSSIDESNVLRDEIIRVYERLRAGASLDEVIDFVIKNYENTGAEK